ncbi:PR-1-like protein [Basidiobolus meristosporus CBS 931.73]|uniref:PR-1-like protein n=1 Tax=Basidiobolus meristosporus CBS 931.73 TaxID=1314790 RepID=A0A1Y1YWZ1_9FUNG|nr:PR-1-like protein [Basidiobolus meristosporus CBS 931.73]ORY02086.1 PR-1-like protein [Basidiobolus meristosporus CBS 931.73]|eukprot:ORY02085.1 PR-1-like protein [Basidiobolus meristosporus CBS 931.73]
MLSKSLITLSAATLMLFTGAQAFSPQRLICLVNTERQNQGLRPLVLSSELNDVCYRHSIMQAQYNRMTHDRYDHSPMDKAINEHGLKWLQYGENVARGQQTEEVVMNVWMHSAPHRRNILNPTFTHMGAALAQPGNYWTQGFATLPGTWNAPVCP